MTLEAHLGLMDQMAKEWHENNDKPKRYQMTILNLVLNH